MMKMNIRKGLFFCVLIMGLSASLASCGSNVTVSHDSEEQATANNKAVVEISKTETEESLKEKDEEVSFQIVTYGDAIKTDFVEMKIEKAKIADTIKPTDTSGVYTYLTDQEDETYFYVTGTLKNVGGDTYSAEEMYVQLTFDNKYNYQGTVIIDDGGDDFYDDEVKPLSSVKYYLVASIPDELINSYQKCRVRFAFHENFEDVLWADFSEYEYRFEIALTK